MARNRYRIALCLSLMSLAGLSLASEPLEAAPKESGDKGAQIYCYMRSNGNNHEVSWKASYAVIKRQSGGLFKSSPEHAAVMITEAVVEEPGNFPECGRYLGDLFGSSASAINTNQTATEQSADSYSDNASNTNTPSTTDSEERYSY